MKTTVKDVKEMLRSFSDDTEVTVNVRDAGDIPIEFMEIDKGNGETYLVVVGTDSYEKSTIPHAVSVGNPYDGLTLYGPFDSYNEALRWSLTDLTGMSSVKIIPLERTKDEGE